MANSERPQTTRPVRLTGAAHQELSRLTGILMARTGERLSFSESLSAAARVAARHVDEMIAQLEAASADTGPRAVAAAVVVSPLGVLAGRRNDGRPPWTFIAGEIEPGETASFAAVRETKEETGLDVRDTGEIGQRVHPATGRTMIYIAAVPVRPNDLAVFVGDPQELAEVRWLTLAEADELLPGMFEPVRAYLAETIAPPAEAS
jgi:8-oxo-dGTP pyrophosphatase MutT (NUDIX family)